MPRVLTRLALTAAVPAVLVASAPAQATTVPGCYGVAVVVCDPTVTVTLPEVVETYSTTVPVCAGACYDVPVTLARSAPGDPGEVCVSYKNRAGELVFSQCRTVAVPTVPTVPDVIPDRIDLNELTDELTEEVVDAMWTVLCRVSVFEDNVQCW